MNINKNVTGFALLLALLTPSISTCNIFQKKEALFSGALTAVAAYVAGKGAGYIHDASTTAGQYVTRDHAEVLGFHVLFVPLCYLTYKQARHSPESWRAYLFGMLSGLTFGIGTELCTRPWDASLFPTFNALLSWLYSADTENP